MYHVSSALFHLTYAGNIINTKTVPILFLIFPHKTKVEGNEEEQKFTIDCDNPKKKTVIKNKN